VNPESHFQQCHFRGHFPQKSEIASQAKRHLTESKLETITAKIVEIKNTPKYGHVLAYGIIFSTGGHLGVHDPLMYF